MTAIGHSEARVNSVESADGTPIGYCSVGAGPGLIVVGGGGSQAPRVTGHSPTG
jgi:hypothetical protein